MQEGQNVRRTQGGIVRWEQEEEGTPPAGHVGSLNATHNSEHYRARSVETNRRGPAQVWWHCLLGHHRVIARQRVLSSYCARC
jgi:hypothetical protein